MKKTETTLQDVGRFFTNLPDVETMSAVKEELQQLAHLLQKKPSMSQLLMSTSIDVPQKMDVLRTEQVPLSVFAERFIVPYLERGDASELADAIDTFVTMYDAAKIEVVTAVPISREQTEKIARFFQKKVEKKYDVWVNTVDPTVLGGVLVRTNENMLDATVLAQLKLFKMELKQD